jgi:sulfoxide reductase heme-binding subunit YedZ
MVSFGKRIPAMPLYAIFLIPLLAVMALRMIAMARRPGGRNAVDRPGIRGPLGTF